MNSNVETKLAEAVERVLRSTSRKKLVIAGPGTGKTALFKKLLETANGDENSRIVLTFINNLKTDLENTLSGSAKVFTLHGYCQSLLHRRRLLRGRLSTDFRCLPGLATLIKSDWKFLRGEPAPPFVDMMRHLQSGDELKFYIERGDYYDAVD